MLSVIRSYCIILILCFLIPQPVSAEKIVQTSGIGVILKDNVASARDRAIRKALNSALHETIAGLFHFSDLMNFNQAVEGFRTDDPLEYISRYRLLSDAREENLYKVEVEAWVLDEEIKKRLSDMGVIRFSNESLQLGILIGTRIDKMLPQDFFSGGNDDFTAFAAQQCQSRGFQIIKGFISVDNSQKSFEKLRANNQLTATQGRRLGSDAVVLGQIEIKSEASRLGLEIPGDYHVSIWVRAIRSTDASLLGIRETTFTLKQNISEFMLRQLIHQNLDSLLAAVGEDIRSNMN
jgi:hypothetical protein